MTNQLVFLLQTHHKGRKVRVNPPPNHCSPVGDFCLHQQIEDDGEQVVRTHGFYTDCRHTRNTHTENIKTRPLAPNQRTKLATRQRLTGSRLTPGLTPSLTPGLLRPNQLGLKIIFKKKKKNNLFCLTNSPKSKHSSPIVAVLLLGLNVSHKKSPFV